MRIRLLGAGAGGRVGATGTATTLATPRAIPPAARHQPEELAVGIDGRGDAVVLWDDYAGYSHGIFASFYRP